MNRVVFTGTGHNGTFWLSSVLSMLGIPTTHEGVYTLNGPVAAWPQRLQCDVSLAAMPYANSSDVTFVRIVRDPLKVFYSFMRGFNFARGCPCHKEADAHFDSPFVSYVRRFMPELDDMPGPIARTCRYILRWNAMGDDLRTYRLEDLDSLGMTMLLESLFPDVGVTQDEIEVVMAMVPNTVNAHGLSWGASEPLQWPRLRAVYEGERLYELAKSFEYVG